MIVSNPLATELRAQLTVKKRPIHETDPATVPAVSGGREETASSQGMASPAASSEGGGGVSFPHLLPSPPDNSHPVPPGFYETEVSKCRWVLPECYSRLRPLGEGAYGVVCTADYAPTGQRVAIKKFSRPFQSTIHAKRTHRELKLLRLLSHDNVLQMIDVFSPDPCPSALRDVYFVSVLIGSDLQNILKIQRLGDDQIQSLLYQVLRGLKYIHSAGIIHRDLKPSNIAVNERCEVKILDFGLARSADIEMTGYVATRWYRAPEIMLNWMHYSQTVDIWSVGCILGELISGKALFPGDDHIDQLTRIMKLVGTPDEQFLLKIQSDEARNYIRNLPDIRRPSFSVHFSSASPAAVDLIQRMLVLDPDARISVVEALAHGYLSAYANPLDEPEAPHLVSTDEEEARAETLPDWKEIIWNEMRLFEESGRRLSTGFPHRLVEDAD